MTERHIPILFSNANFGVKALLTPPEWIGKFALKAGYDGLEIVPFHWTAKRYAEAVTEHGLAIRSLHQGFRPSAPDKNYSMFVEETGLNLTDTMMRLPVLGPAIIGPDMPGSAHFMAELQEKTGLYVPGTFYPQEDPARDMSNLRTANTTEKLFQPTDHVARLVRAKSIADLLGITADRGYTGVVYDIYHARRRYLNTPTVVSPEGQALAELAPHVKALHVSLGRIEFESTQPLIPTRKELADALKGNFEGVLAENLSLLRTEAPIQYIVVELAMGSMRAVTGKRGRANMLAAYRDIRQSVSACMGVAV